MLPMEIKVENRGFQCFTTKCRDRAIIYSLHDIILHMAGLILCQKMSIPPAPCIINSMVTQISPIKLIETTYVTKVLTNVVKV